MGKIFSVYASNGSNRYAELDLPASVYEVLDLMERLRLPPGQPPRLEILKYHRCGFLKSCIDGQLDIYQLNALAKKLSEMRSVQGMAVFEGLVEMERRSGTVPIPLARLMDFACSEDCCYVAPGVTNDRQLGRFLAENGILPEIEGFTDTPFHLVDFEQAGREHRQAEGGVFTSFGYVEPHTEPRHIVEDTMPLRLKDILGKKPVPGNPNFPNGVSPHIWDDYGKAEWYAFRPTAADYEKIRQAAGDYLEVFRERETVRETSGPKLVYICAPLRGDVEKNIEFARQKAQEVFQAGDIPVCPHLLLPPIADPENPAQDQAAREMGLRLVESCQEVHVYGPEWTEGMWAEIRHAMDLGIEVKTDQKTIGRSQPHRQAARKGKGAR